MGRPLDYDHDEYNRRRAISKRMKQIRHCKHCGARLNSYNPTKYCAAHSHIEVQIRGDIT